MYPGHAYWWRGSDERRKAKDWAKDVEHDEESSSSAVSAAEAGFCYVFEQEMW